jgi:3-hydroxyisobutyrate dehydrogenase
MKKIAFLGMGRMGAPMAANLAHAGFDVVIWNRTADRPGMAHAVEAGARAVATLEEACAQRDAVLSCLGDVPDVQQVLCRGGGVIDHAPGGALVIDFSTIGPDAARDIARALATRGLRFLDAPVSGGDVGARAGTLTVMVGGEAEDFHAAADLFDAVGKAVHHCGPVGAGQAVKLCNQVLAAANMLAVTEALVLARTIGIDPQLVVEVCRTGAAGSWALEKLGPKILARDFAPGFSIRHILKDLRLVEEAADEAAGDDADVELPGVDLAVDQFEAVAELDEGRGAELGTHAMILAYESDGDAAGRVEDDTSQEQDAGETDGEIDGRGSRKPPAP